MIEVVSCASPADKRRLFDAFDPRGRTWVVSDLQSKWHLQKTLLARDGVLDQACVMRATELWRAFNFQIEPDLRLLSAELAQTLFWTWIEPMNLDWARSPRAVPVVIDQMQMWMTVLSDPRAAEVMGEWFEANRESFVRWGHWFELCLKIWRRCREERVMMISWLPALLLRGDLGLLQFNRALTFDLGAQVSPVEGQLVRELGKNFDVTVLFPEAPWINLMPNTLRPYDDALGRPHRGDPAWAPPRRESFGFGRFATQLAEVKDAVARVREWLDAGVAPQSIALVAPDIEAYWPALRLYLDEEGVPACKPLTARLGTFPEISRWAATLRTAVGRISAGDLEVYLLGGAGAPRLSFDRFRVLFSHVYDAFDIGRAEALFADLTPPDPEVRWAAPDFLAWGLRYFPAEATSERLIEVLRAAGQEVPADLRLRPGEWLGYLEGLLARREIPVRGADETGVWCTSLSSADWLPVTHGIFLNLAEGALRTLRPTPVGDGEGQKVFTDTGWPVGTNDRQELEFELLWFLNREWTELRLTFAETDFEGRVMTPSRLWMWTAFVNGLLKTHAEAARTTRWDELQRGSIEHLMRARAGAPAHRASVEFGLRRDADGTLANWPVNDRTRVSASGLRDFAACPFIYAAGRKLNLSSEPALDLDLDPRQRGSLLHAVAEALIVEPVRFDQTDGEILAVIDQARTNAGVNLGDVRTWPVVRAQHLRLGRQLLEFEREWRARFPATRTVARELGFRCGWNVETSEPTADTRDVVLSGRIDRVDRDAHGRLGLVDYKGSSGALVNWASWLQNDDVQMPLYAALLEAGRTELPAAPVVSANYFVIKEADRRKGFHLNDDTAELYDPNFKHRNFIDAEQKQRLFAEVREKVNAAVTRMRAGDFNPRPKTLGLCDGCEWRSQCRAPHLT